VTVTGNGKTAVRQAATHKPARILFGRVRQAYVLACEKTGCAKAQPVFCGMLTHLSHI